MPRHRSPFHRTPSKPRPGTRPCSTCGPARSLASEAGALAVWIGVAAPQRAEAFAGCREIIDEVKARVPLWKTDVRA